MVFKDHKPGSVALGTSVYDPWVFLIDFFFFFEIRSCCVAQPILELVELLLRLPPEFWHSRCAPPYQTLNDLLMRTEAESRKYC